MRKLYLVLIAAIGIIPFAQSQTYESESFGSETYYDQSDPHTTRFAGATKINIQYLGNWTGKDHIKGALEYACRLWEERLPSAYPILINVSLGTIRPNSTSALAKTTVTTSTTYSSYWNLNVPQAVIKRYMWLDYMANWTNIAAEPTFLTTPDGTITFSSNENLFYYSIDDATDTKYYFVTTALREIAKILGFYSDATLNAAGTGLDLFAPNMDNVVTPYVYWMYEDYLSSPNAALNFATSGNVTKSTPFDYYTYPFYSPSTFQENMSLAYFDEDSDNLETLLMQPYQDKGANLKNIPDPVFNLINDVLRWRGDVLVGIGDDNSLPIGVANATVIPYNTGITFGTGTFSAMYQSLFNSQFPELANLNVTAGTKVKSMTTNQQERILRSSLVNTNIYDYTGQFSEYPVGANGSFGWTVGVMKNDGTWDLILDQTYSTAFPPSGYGSITISSALIDSTKVGGYARTSDGFLRIRISLYDEHGYLWDTQTKCIYRTLDYKPAEPKISFSRIVEEPASVAALSSPVQSLSGIQNDEWTMDVVMSLKDLEGVESVLVQQWDEYTPPFLYYVPDFKKGQFVASVDIEFPTSFRVSYINQNGATISKEVYTYEPLEQTTSFSFAPVIVDNGSTLNLNFEANTTSRRQVNNKIKSYKIANIVNPAYNINGKAVKNSNINISSLPKGMYAIQVIDERGNTYTSKFTK